VGSWKRDLKGGGSVQVYNYDKGRTVEGRYAIPLYVVDDAFTAGVTLTADEAFSLAHELIQQAMYAEDENAS
jgi:hypothetical protein